MWIAFLTGLFVVSYWISTSNHNLGTAAYFFLLLYLIEFLHQTTTMGPIISIPFSCILLNFYIKPQLLGAGGSRYSVVSYWISTSNHNGCPPYSCYHQLYLIEFLHQTTTLFRCALYRSSCILLNFYIKPQLFTWRYMLRAVVSYWISTSNHNLRISAPLGRSVVSYWISTSNHNLIEDAPQHISLYLIEFLHQTTTIGYQGIPAYQLYLIEFLHQTTTEEPGYMFDMMLYLIEFLHQTTTVHKNSVFF